MAIPRPGAARTPNVSVENVSGAFGGIMRASTSWTAANWGAAIT